MGHNSRCAEATRPGCRCTGCGGAQHGWQGTFTIAAEPTGRRAREFADDREKDWQNKPKSLTVAQAAVGCALADIVGWLHREKALLEGAQEVTRPFDRRKDDPERGRLLREIENRLGPDRTKMFQGWAVDVHFWCELLAQAAHALESLRRVYRHGLQAVDVLLARARETAERLVLQVVDEHLGQPPGLGRQEVQTVIRLATGSLFETLPLAVRGALGADAIFEFIWPVRVLAVVMCKDPSKHEAVCQYCLDPICVFTRAKVRTEVRDRLLENLKREWLPLTAELSQQ
ncbi:hypothetical protein Arub01_16500 [Actinomadura rubrobrunea]|uniref:Uncharacterized protein n=2 Tax=Actinomadura rubrobrunea TaxID=115335 RepID=A0A9W6UT95_9ACTN|nr:hypothetical protein Arub01_16500 [Actinomadura rubrobrunea]